MSRKYKYKHEQIAEICKTAQTFTEIEARYGTCSPNSTLRKYIKFHKIPMPMYSGQHAACRLSQKSRSNYTVADLKIDTLIPRGVVKRILIKEGLKKEKCEKCGWCERRQSDGKTPVNLHHVNGDSLDNRPENLQMLCPNCHSLTENYTGKNKQRGNPWARRQRALREAYYSAPKQICVVCGKLGYGDKYCSNECSHQSQRKTEWPTKEQLAQEIQELSWTAIGRKYGVSDNAVRKWARHYELAV